MAAPVIETATHLGAMGIDLAIGDFGTGFSSLAQVSRLPVREIKIDRSFIAAKLGREDDSALRHIVDLGHTMGLNRWSPKAWRTRGPWTVCWVSAATRRWASTSAPRSSRPTSRPGCGTQPGESRIESRPDACSRERARFRELLTCQDGRAEVKAYLTGPTSAVRTV